MAALGYDAAGILADAIDRAGDTDGREAARRDRRDQGLRGRHRQDHASTPQRNARKDAVVLKIEGGKFKFYRSVPAS